MDTIYYRLNAARITAEGDQKVSGGEGTCYAVLPRRTRPVPEEGKVLDFAACRRRLLAEEETHAPAEPVLPEEAEKAPAPRRGLSPWLLADLCASVAVVGFAALAAFGVLLG